MTAWKRARLDALFRWRDASAGELRELHAIVGGWAHVQHDYHPSFERSHPGAPTFERWAAQLAIALVDLAKAVADGRGADAALEPFADALVELHGVPPFTLTVAPERRGRPDARASALTTVLVAQARDVCSVVLQTGGAPVAEA